MESAMTSLASDVWAHAGTMLSELGPIIGIFVGLGAALYVAGTLIGFVRGR